MDIQIDYKNAALSQDQKDKLLEMIKIKFDHYPFLTSAKVNVIGNEQDLLELKIKMHAKKGRQIFVQKEGSTLSQITQQCIKKLSTQIEKYKQVHYKNP